MPPVLSGIPPGSRPRHFKAPVIARTPPGAGKPVPLDPQIIRVFTTRPRRQPPRPSRSQAAVRLSLHRLSRRKRPRKYRPTRPIRERRLRLRRPAHHTPQPAVMPVRPAFPSPRPRPVRRHTANRCAANRCTPNRLIRGHRPLRLLRRHRPPPIPLESGTPGQAKPESPQNDHDPHQPARPEPPAPGAQNFSYAFHWLP